jgi:hypothetical protein
VVASVKEEVICPTCKKPSLMTRKWVLNRYGKRYDYLIYRHEDAVHYSNESPLQSRSFKKGILKKTLIDIINSESFKNGLFSAEEARLSLLKMNQRANLDSIRDSLYQLVELGMLKSIKKDRKVYFINAAYSDRLSFVDDSLKVILSDIDGDGLFRRHVSNALVRNDKKWPLVNLPYKILGDSEIEFEKICFKARDLTHKVELKTIVIEDNPLEKRLLLKLTKPLLPNETIRIRFEYDWSELNQSFFHTAATFMKSFNLTFLGNRQLEARATLSESDLNEVIDLSKSIKIDKKPGWNYVYSLKLKAVKSFSVMQFRWKNI